MSPFRGHKDCLDIETVFGGFVLANAPDFIDDGVLAMSYSPMSASGVLMTGHSHPYSRRMEASALKSPHSQ